MSEEHKGFTLTQGKDEEGRIQWTGTDGKVTYTFPYRWDLIHKINKVVNRRNAPKRKKLRIPVQYVDYVHDEFFVVNAFFLKYDGNDGSVHLEQQDGTRKRLMQPMLFPVVENGEYVILRYVALKMEEKLNGYRRELRQEMRELSELAVRAAILDYPTKARAIEAESDLEDQLEAMAGQMRDYLERDEVGHQEDS